MSFYLVNAFKHPHNQPITLSISFSFNIYLLQNSHLIKSSPIDDTLEVSLKVFNGFKSVLFLRFFSSETVEMHFSEEETCSEVHELLSDIKQKQRKILEANILDLTLERTLGYKYNHKSGKKVLKYLNISHDIEEIQWSNSLDSIKYSSIKFKDIIDFSIGPISRNFQRVLHENPLEIEDFCCCFSLKTPEKTVDIRIPDENQARLWILGLTRVLRSQRILKIPEHFYLNQPFSFTKFLNHLRQKSYEMNTSIKNLIINCNKMMYPAKKIDSSTLSLEKRYNNQRNSLKYLSLGNLNKRTLKNSEALKSIESYINPLNQVTKNEKIPLRKSQTERNFLKPNNSLPKNMKNSDIKDKENQETYNYRANTSINLEKNPQKARIKLSFDKSSLKQKVWALIQEKQVSKSFITTHNESFSINSLKEMKKNTNKTKNNSIDNLTIEIANIDLVSSKKKEKIMNMTGTGIVQEEFDDLNKRYKKLLDEYLAQSKDNEKLMQKILDLNRILREKNEEIHELKFNPLSKTNLQNIQMVNFNTKEAQFQKEIHNLKEENNKLKESLNQQKTNIFLRKPSLNLSDRGYEGKTLSNNMGNFKDLIIKNQKLLEENNLLKKRKEESNNTKNEEFKKIIQKLKKQIKKLKIDLMELKMMQQDDLGKFEDLWPHLFKIFEYQQQKLIKSEAKILSYDKENKILMQQMKSFGNR